MRRLAIWAALALGACQQGSAPENGTAVAEAMQKTPATASEVANALAAQNLPIENVTVLTETTDPNELLGRPNQYTSKVFFYDHRHPQEGDEGNQNTIEVFATADDAKVRHDYVAAVTKGVAIATQYQVLRGPVLVRLDKALLPSEVDGYRAAVEKAVPTQ